MAFLFPVSHKLNFRIILHQRLVTMKQTTEDGDAAAAAAAAAADDDNNDNLLNHVSE